MDSPTKTFNASRLDFFRKHTPDWMTYVDDQAKISAMSIPGTHETCAFYNIFGRREKWLDSPGLTMCQDKSILDQLNGGIRFLDIRCRRMGDGLAIHHGSFYQKANFNDVLKDCNHFLIKHPSETILISVREECEPGENALSFYDAFKKEVDKNGDQLWPRLYQNNQIPTLGQVRGKIIIFKRSGAIQLPCSGIRLDDFSNGSHTNPDGVRYSVQDYYDLDGDFGIGKKMEKVRAQFNKINTNSNEFSFNFLNGSKTRPFWDIWSPWKVVDKQGINRYTTEFIKSQNWQKNWGIVAMDFFGHNTEDMIAHLLASNNDRTPDRTVVRPPTPPVPILKINAKRDHLIQLGIPSSGTYDKNHNWENWIVQKHTTKFSEEESYDLLLIWHNKN